jgi:hypothetical protein
MQENLGMPTVLQTFGSLTMLQALSRDLQAGETRPGLVTRAAMNIKTRDLLLHSGLLKKAEAIVGTKLSLRTGATTA